MGRRPTRAAVALYAASVVLTAVFVYVVSKTDPEANLVDVWLIFITFPTSFVVLDI